MSKNVILCAVACVIVGLMAAPTWATSPYDTAYGIQWNFQIGNESADNPTNIAASEDGSVWITTGSQGKTGNGPTLTWGNPTGIYGGHYASGYGQIDQYGQILQGQDIPAIPDLTNYNQGYVAGITMLGTTAHFTWYNNQDAYWANQTPADLPAKGNPMGVTVPTAAGSAQGTPYDNPGLTKYNHSLLSSNSPDPVTGIKGGYGGTGDSQVLSDGSMVFCGRVQPPAAGGSSDKFTAGDFSGTVGYNQWVGKVEADGTLSGPAHQPAGDATRDYFTDIAANEGNGQVFAVGWGYQGAPTSWDPDGPGPLAPHMYASTNPAAGIGNGVLYDAAWNIVTAVVWESAAGGEGINDVVATPDDGWILVGSTPGDLKAGATNPAPGTDDIYIAKYDAAGTMVWDYQSETAVGDFGGDVTVDPEGNIYVSGNTDGNPYLMKMTAAGAPVWTRTIDNNGSIDSQRDHGNVDKHKIYLLSENRPYSSTDPTTWVQEGDLWPNTTGYVPFGTDEVLLQKLSPGDFNIDGYVNFDDAAQAAGAIGAGLPGVDTYDFDEDGNSTFDDVKYMVTNILDRLMGDANLDGDVDVWAIDGSGDAQILSSNLGTMIGMSWSDGDFSFDGDVDVWAFDGTGDAQILSENLGATLDAAAGTAEAIYNAVTGELTLDVGEGVAVVGLQAEGLKHGDVDSGSPLGAPAQNGGNVLAYFSASGLTAGMSSVGNVLPVGLAEGDIAFSYTPIGGASTVVPVTVIVPEPSTIAMLLVVGALALCLRRRSA